MRMKLFIGAAMAAAVLSPAPSQAHGADVIGAFNATPFFAGSGGTISTNPFFTGEPLTAAQITMDTTADARATIQPNAGATGSPGFFALSPTLTTDRTVAIANGVSPLAVRFEGGPQAPVQTAAIKAEPAAAEQAQAKPASQWEAWADHADMPDFAKQTVPSYAQ